MRKEYKKFLENKQHSIDNSGIPVNFMPDRLFDFQKHIVERSVMKGRCAVFADTGLGKALESNTRIFTPNGFTPIKDLVVGYEVFGSDGKPTKVTGVYPQGIRKAYRVTFSDGASILCDGSHLWNVRNKVDKYRGKPYRTMTTLQILESGITSQEGWKWFIPMCRPIEFEKKVLPIHPYLLGVLIGDGGITKSIRLSSADEEILERVQTLIPSPLTLKYQSNYDWAITGKPSGGHIKNELIEGLRTLGLYGKKSQFKFIPDIYKYSSVNDRIEMLRGLMDTDGTVSQDNNFNFGTTSERLANDVVFLVQSLGGKTTIRHKKTTHLPFFRMSIALPNDIVPFWLARKREAAKPRLKYPPTRAIVSIEEEGECDMTCISVAAENKLYVADQFIVTHNTSQELVAAQNIVNHTNKRVLILTPLAVAFQFLDEAAKLGIDDIEQTKDGKFTKKIIVCNYERLHYLDPKDFVCCICDESGIMKAFDGKVKNQITQFMRKTEYRFLFTAMPAPNDFIELGTSSEALGYLGYMDMLSRFFRNNQSSIDIRHSGDKWYLKPHAETDFWKWVAGWSIAIRKPSDLGFSDGGYILPELVERSTTVLNEKPLEINGQGSLFNFPAVNFHEIKAESRATLEKRCETAVKLASQHETSVYWANLNDEAELIGKLDANAVEIKGKMNLDKKEEILIAFGAGEIKKLISKTSITCYGLNWQHCNHTTYFPTFSYEQYYQAIRRFWRFGQKRDVVVDLVLSDGQSRIMEAIKAKKQKADEMFTNLMQHINSDFKVSTKDFNQEIIKPSFL